MSQKKFLVVLGLHADKVVPGKAVSRVLYGIATFHSKSGNLTLPGIELIKMKQSTSKFVHFCVHG